MFNMHEIGRTISSHRKSKNMTQLELADKLGVSYQAVSNWECGNNMPDISKLPELAEIFDISLDQLLGENSPLVEAAANDRIEECIDTEQISDEELSNALPLLKPTQVDLIVKNKRSLKNISIFLPFLSSKDVSRFASEALAQGESIQCFLPFLSSEDVNKYAAEALAQGESIQCFLPFLSSEDVSKYAAEALAQGEGIQCFLPFLSSKDVNKYAAEALAQGESIQCFLPFLSSEDVNKYAAEALAQGKNIQPFLPFLSSDSVREFAEKAWENK